MIDEQRQVARARHVIARVERHKDNEPVRRHLLVQRHLRHALDVAAGDGSTVIVGDERERARLGDGVHGRAERRADAIGPGRRHDGIYRRGIGRRARRVEHLYAGEAPAAHGGREQRRADVVGAALRRRNQLPGDGGHRREKRTDQRATDAFHALPPFGRIATLFTGTPFRDLRAVSCARIARHIASARRSGRTVPAG